MRPEVHALVAMGEMPDEDASEDDIEQWGKQFDLIARPLTNEEASALAQSFSSDMAYGMGWSLLHLLETAPGWRQIASDINDPEWRDEAVQRIRLEEEIIFKTAKIK